MSRRFPSFRMLVIILVLLLLFFPISSVWFMVTQPFVWPAHLIEPTFKARPEILEAHVRVLSERFVPRSHQDVENLNLTADYIRKNFAKTNGRISEQEFEVNGAVYRNVICSFGPSSGERVVVGAHYDAFGPYPGADDNASSVAGLLELAYGLDKTTPTVRVDLVAYTLEEPPIFRSENMGSAVHTASLKDQDIGVRLMISLEMIGYFSDEEGSQTFPASLLKLFYPTRGNFVSVIGSIGDTRMTRQTKKGMKGVAALPVYSMNAPKFVPGVDFSDHLSYWAAGYPAIMVTDTAFYRNKSYHTEKDVADRLDYHRMALVVEGVFNAVLLVGQSS